MNNEVMAMLGKYMEERGSNCPCDDICNQFEDEFRFRYKTIREYDCELVAHVECCLKRECFEPAERVCKGHRHGCCC